MSSRHVGRNMFGGRAFSDGSFVGEGLRIPFPLLPPATVAPLGNVRLGLGLQYMHTLRLLPPYTHVKSECHRNNVLWAKCFLSFPKGAVIKPQPYGATRPLN